MIEDSALLIEYAANRTESAFAELVRRHLDLVYSAAMRRSGGNAHQAQDIVQLVFNDLARKAGDVARHPTLAGWLHTATRNAAINAARAERRRRHYEAEAFTMNELTSASAPDLDWTRLQPVLDEVIDRLPQSDRDAVVLRFLEARPFADIGQTLRISEDAARMRVDRALEKLRRLLVRRGVTSTALALSLGLTGHTAMAAPGEMAATVTDTALAQAASAGSAGGLASLWAAAAGSKYAIGATVAAVLAVVGITAFVVSAQTAGPGNIPPPIANPEAPASLKPDRKSRPTISLANLAARAESLDNRSAPTRRDAARAQVTAGERAKMLRNYAPLFEHHAQAPIVREQLVTLLVDEFEVAADFAAAAGASGVDVTADPALFNVSVRQLREKVWGQIRILLGEEGYAEYRKLRQNLRAESWASGLEKKLEASAEPLSAEQSLQFRMLLNEDGREPNDPATIVEASRFLSPIQMAGLRELHSERIAGSRSPKVQDALRESAAQKPANP